VNCLVDRFQTRYVGVLHDNTGHCYEHSRHVKVLLGSLHNLRLMFARYDFLTENVRISESGQASREIRKLTYLGHGMAGLCAGLTSAFLATPIEMLKGKLSSHLHFLQSSREVWP
jgi:solute carrier family 25 carnitine/acylcarnitine transporter 20/29